MLDDFIQHTMAQVDDLAELKISLAAIRWLEQRQSEVASVRARDLAALQALRDGLGFAPQIALEAGLKRAVARGTLLVSTSPSLDEPHYFLNNPASRRAIDAIELADARRTASSAPFSTSATYQALEQVERETVRLELIDIYPAAPQDAQMVEEWLAQGYSVNEIVGCVRETLQVPRPKGTPPRLLTTCAPRITSQPPVAPSRYYRTVIARSAPPPDEIIAFRELAGRWPNGHEFNLIEAAVGMYGSHATITMMKKIVSAQSATLDNLVPLLSEREEAELALAHAQALPNLFAREMIQLYENAFGLPPTSRIAQDIAELANEIADRTIWEKVFQYAATHNKRNWEYVRKLVKNPSPALFEPPPVNDTARFVFDEFKRRIGHGYLDETIAEDINRIAQEITDRERWTHAFKEAAAHSVLNWTYLRAVVTNPNSTKANEAKDGRRKQGTGSRQRGLSRRPQVEESTEAEREAARELARQRIAERAKRHARDNKLDNTQ
ncbi:MAG: hypothetical protein M1434_03650 [Chloroflexi bacterium]|nr:hypothetical protein [Chloroflexota bacterium]MCL5273826.1 hypothetical protein [Chloroflexota bacterium]